MIQGDHGDSFAMSNLLQDFRKTFWINNSQRTAKHVLSHLHEMGRVPRDLYPLRPGNKSFPLLVQYLVWDDPDEGATHEGTSVGRADQLFSRDGEHEFQ